MFVVVFEHPEYVVEFRSRDQDHAYPVMDDSRRARDFFPAVARLELLHFHFAALQSCVGFGALWRRQFVNPKQICAALQLVRVSRFGESDIAVESLLRICMQLGWFRFSALREIGDRWI